MGLFGILLLCCLVLLILFFFALFRMAKSILGDRQFFLSELILGALYVGLATALARTSVYSSPVFEGNRAYVVVLFQFFFMLSVLAVTAYGLRAMKLKQIDGRKIRILLLLTLWTIGCGPWFFILYAVLTHG